MWKHRPVFGSGPIRPSYLQAMPPNKDVNIRNHTMIFGCEGLLCLHGRLRLLLNAGQKHQMQNRSPPAHLSHQLLQGQIIARQPCPYTDLQAQPSTACSVPTSIQLLYPLISSVFPESLKKLSQLIVVVHTFNPSRSR